MKSVEIKDNFKKIAILNIVLFVFLLLAILFFINFLFNNALITLVIGLIEIIVFLLTFRFKNKKIYYLGLGTYILLSRESEIRISDDLIKVIIQEQPHFLIFWNEFDVIKIKKNSFKLFHWSRILRFKKFEVEFQFYSQYADYQKDLKYIGTLVLSSRNFSERSFTKIIDTLKALCSELNKSLIITNNL